MHGPPTRRALLLAATAATAMGGGMARPRAARAATALNVVLESEAVILDPYFTTAAITRSFGYHVYDTLFAMNDSGAIRPQMVERYEASADALTWRFTLRENLRFHDGSPVTARDCVLSLNRWAPRDPMGRLLLAAGAAFDAADAATLVLTLREAFPLVLEVLGKPNAPVPFILPERLARTPGDQRLAEVIGSGPFTFRPDLWRPGNSMTLEKFSGYVPRAEPPDFLAGGKSARIDTLVLRVMPDQATASSALIAGEIDYQQYVPFDMIPRLERARGVSLLGLGGLHMFQGNYRLNHAVPPFDDPAIRRVLWSLVDQRGVLQAIGVPDRYAVADCPSVFMCDSPYESRAGAAALSLSIDRAREALKRSAYAGQPVVMLEVSSSISQTASAVLAQNLRQAGFTVDQQAMDWGTVLARRVRRDGWSLFSVYANGIDMISPLTHFYVANTCADYPGWSCDDRVPPLLAAFARAGTQEERRRIAADIQGIVYGLTPALMWGQFTIPAAHRSDLRGLVRSSFPMFWNVER